MKLVPNWAQISSTRRLRRLGTCGNHNNGSFLLVIDRRRRQRAGTVWNWAGKRLLARNCLSPGVNKPLAYKFTTVSQILSILVHLSISNKMNKSVIKTRSIQRTQTSPCMWPLTLCGLHLLSRSRKLMSLDVAYNIGSRYDVYGFF